MRKSAGHALSKATSSRRDDVPRSLYLAVFISLVLTFFRPQTFFPILEALHPIQLCTGAILVLWLNTKPKTVLRDPIFRWQLGLLSVMFMGLPGVANHYWWLYVVTDYVTLIIMFSLGVVSVSRSAEYRTGLLRLTLIGFLFGACWVVTHDGRGPRFSWLYDENDAAAALTVGICLAYAMWMESRSALWRILGLITLVTCVAGIVLTMSRGGFLAAIAAAAVIALTSRKFVRTSLLAALIAIAALPLVPEKYWSEVQSIGGDVANVGTPSKEMERVYTWRRAWDMFLDNPILGVGAGNLPWRIASYEMTPAAIAQRGGRPMVAGRVAHSIYFTILPELGLLGTVAFLVIMAKSALRAQRIAMPGFSDIADESFRTIARFVPPAIVGYCIAGAFISVMWYPALWLLASFAMSLPASRARISPPTPTLRNGSASRAAHSRRPTTSNRREPLGFWVNARF